MSNRKLEVIKVHYCFIVKYIVLLFQKFYLFFIVYISLNFLIFNLLGGCFPLCPLVQLSQLLYWNLFIGTSVSYQIYSVDFSLTCCRDSRFCYILQRISIFGGFFCLFILPLLLQFTWLYSNCKLHLLFTISNLKFRYFSLSQLTCNFPFTCIFKGSARDLGSIYTQNLKLLLAGALLSRILLLLFSSGDCFELHLLILQC